MKFSALVVYFLVGSAFTITSEGASWVFDPGRFTHDPITGARVAQYARKPPIEPLADTRAVTSRYRRTQTVLRGTDGARDTYYQVQSWGNGRGGIDAEWERFHNAWQSSFLTGSYHQSGSGPSYGYEYPRGGYGGFPVQGGLPPGAGHYPQHGYFSNPGYFPPHGPPVDGSRAGWHNFVPQGTGHGPPNHHGSHQSE